MRVLLGLRVSVRCEAVAAMSAESVTWTKIVLTGVPGMVCGKTVDGRELPPDAQLHGCGKPARWMLGHVFICADHSREVAEVLGDDIDAIDAAWRAEL